MLSVTSEELSDWCWECKSLGKAFCYFVLNPDVTYQPGLPGSTVTWPNRQQHRRDVDRALLTLLDHLWAFSKFKVFNPYLIYLFTIAMAGTSTTGVTRRGVKGTDCPFTGIKLCVRCAGTQAHCRVCSHVTTQQHLLFQGTF